MSDVYDNGEIMRDPRMIALCTGCDKPECRGICGAVSQLARQIAKEHPVISHGGKLYDVDGESRTLLQWSAVTGISKYTLSKRIRRGLSMAEAIRVNRRGQMHEIDGVFHTMAEWAEIAGVSQSRLSARMSEGKTLAQAVAMGRRRRY